MDNLNQVLIGLLDDIKDILQDGGVVCIISMIIIFLFCLSLFRRLIRYRILIGFGIWLLSIGCVGLIILVAKVFSESSGVVDIWRIIKIGVGLTLLIFVGGKVAVIAGKYSSRQKHFERQVDWFHDAWNSRNRRW